MGFIIAGDRSGTGKTTVTLALLAALAQRSPTVQSFKVGPDYIDPMFHRAVTGRPCYTLDPVLTSEDYVRTCYAQHSAGYTVVEGVMGLFDGASPDADWGSTAHVARLLNLPVVLVVDCARLSRSLAALVLGYAKLDPRVQITGVILNRVGSDRHLAFLQSALAEVDMSVLGVLRREAEITLPDRHLGLVPTGEVTTFQTIAARLAHLAQGFAWEQIDRLAQAPGRLGPAKHDPTVYPAAQSTPPTLAIARDDAFNFYYPTNLSLLEQAGAKLQFWSPLQDPFPSGVHGLYLGGGFPEVFAAALSQNSAALAGVQRAIARGLPTYAECGGLMYLCQTLTDFDGRTWPMAGVLDAAIDMAPRLTLGYRRSIALQSGPLLAKGDAVVGHEFHRSRLQQPLSHPMYQSQRAFSAVPEPLQLEGTGHQSLHASYLHLHWGARPDIPQRFVECCRQHRAKSP